ncbi:MAG: hypothetical protein HGA97_01115 [Chlorobiaceae bacterium]|nr:hypothetical protein [Chlorobiaceae bacterium]
MHATNSHILPPPAEEWPARLAEAVATLDDAFWSRSYNSVNTSEREAIVSIVGGRLAMLLESFGPEGSMRQLRGLGLQPRLQRHVEDLSRLHDSMGFVLPPNLLKVRDILQAGSERVMRTMCVYLVEGWPRLNPWQQALVDHLNAKAAESGHVPDASLFPLLESAVFEPSGQPGTSLRFMQEKLFSLPPAQELDESSLQWLAVRDHLQEVEVAAGMVQSALGSGSAATYADFGLLLPDDRRYGRAVRSVFAMAGIPLSGLTVETAARDLGREAVLNLLLCLDKPAPVMALAALLASPLMPWGLEEGNKVAQYVVKGRFRLHAPESAGDKGRRMLDLVTLPVGSAKELDARLAEFAVLMDRSETLAAHRERAESLCGLLRSSLEGSGPVDWVALRSMATPERLAAQPFAENFLEGVAVFEEGREPWRRVRHLIVLGCSSGHYPATESGNGIFTDTDLEELRQKGGLDLETSVDRNSRHRDLFRRQLASASGQATFLVPRRDALGKPLEPSASLIFAAALFKGGQKAEGLMLDLEKATHLRSARGVPRAGNAVASSIALSTEDLRFDEDLLKIVAGADGAPASETPSRLDTLLVSPLGWLLERLELEPREWDPEAFDVKAKGTLAHAVFEHLFAPGGPLPDDAHLEAMVAELLDKAIDDAFLFLKRGEWMVEVGHLRQEIVKSAKRWKAMLQAIGARVAATEIPLEGTLEGRPINGKADLLLELDGERLVVVDYKKSSSGTREKRMNAGYDLQAELYRTMITSGGVRQGSKVDESAVALVNRFRNSDRIGTLYYLMNDQMALSATKGWFPDIASLVELETDVSCNAIREVEERLKNLEAGILHLNSDADAKVCYEERGLSTFALDKPLVKLFMKPAGQAGEGQETEVADA